MNAIISNFTGNSIEEVPKAFESKMERIYFDLGDKFQFGRKKFDMRTRSLVPLLIFSF